MSAFSAQDVVTLSGQSAGSVAISLNRWVKSERLERLRRGLYTLNENDRKVPLSRALIASLLVEPSYLSGVWVLANDSVIPEAVFTVTSATKGRRLDFANAHGSFAYRRIPERAWFGFKVKEVRGGNALFADAEKALLDTIYWSRSVWGEDRFKQERVNPDRIQVKRLKRYAAKWRAPALLKSVDAFIQYKESSCLTW
ncbi:type IV toxin-antitoxin system AbiEi family antitoxin domain-containing protein [Coraliomargarita sp. W4R72]